MTFLWTISVNIVVDAQTVTPESKDLSYIVYYSMIEEPDKPNTPDKPSVKFCSLYFFELVDEKLELA